MISGIQHFAFCRRQWALIHVECQWQENLRTVEGEIIHEKCHDETFTEKRDTILISRGIRIFSSKLGVSGQCDVVEFTQADEGAVLNGRKGVWNVCPIEYKRGKSKEDDSDVLQLCCQGMCLEEMLACEIHYGYLFYNETHRRERVEFTLELREKVRDIFKEMHKYYKRGYTPKVKTNSKCRSCSLKELCMPALCKKISVDAYYKMNLGVEENASST